MMGVQPDPVALALASGPDLRPPERDAWGPGVTLAVVAHALLIAALAWGVNWRSHQEEAVEAEVWAAVPDAAAPPPVVVSPPPPPPVQATEPVVRPVPSLQEDPEAELAAVKRKAPEPKAKHREREVFDATPPKPRKTEPSAAELKAKMAELQAERERLLKEQAQKDKLAKEQAAKDKLAKEKAEQAEREKADKQAKDKAAKDKAAKDAEAKRQAAEQAALDAQRQRNLSDIMRQAGGGNTPGATGQGARNAGPSAAYGGRLKALFKRNLTWAFDDAPGNPETVVSVTVAPDGVILARNIVTRSGLPAWDDAVLRAIDRTEVLPPDETGKVPPRLTLTFRMKDY